MHSLLERQLSRHWGGDPNALPEEWRDFIAAVDAYYRAADEDLALRERSMDAMLKELTERNRSLQREKSEQEALVKKLADMQTHLLQSEKLAALGQLAAGVAHEINNPIGFVNSNLGSLEHYFVKLHRILDHVAAGEPMIDALGAEGHAFVAALRQLKEESDYAYLMEDIPALLAESREGVTRVRKIVQDLRDFSRADTRQEWEMANLREGIESTLNIVHNEIKYHADVVLECGDLPRVECIPSQLNQVFMNLLVNAAHAMPEGKRGTITVRCHKVNEEAWIEIADTGVGIARENLQRIFDPFFTTKPIGKGTGLGLSLSYGIVERHHGRIEVQSEQGVGTTFRIILPVHQHRSSETMKGS
ncbi:MAG: ATP-binding protein [Rhodocyclaceae bacterium]|jgi:signal transduction histidine kinase|nr:ATP-binding protein [Rhodocyclaceae bacterium]